MGDWLSEIVDSLSGAASDMVSGIATAMEWVSGSDLPDGSDAASSAVSGSTSPADAMRLGADSIGSDWASGAAGSMFSNTAEDKGVWTAAGLKNMLSDLSGWAEKNPKTMVALGSAASALLKRNESNTTNEILRAHYASQDATAAGKLALEQTAQQNAMTSGQNLNVSGLPATKPSGLITSNVDIPGGFNDRFKRNRNYGAPA